MKDERSGARSMRPAFRSGAKDLNRTTFGMTQQSRRE
jgi:hypothetical protein